MEETEFKALRKGTRLHHSLFGAGSFEGLGKGFGDSGNSARIKFDDHGIRELCLSFAASKLHRIPKAKKAKA
jgi:hypothetical protein